MRLDYLLDADCCIYVMGGEGDVLRRRLGQQEPGSVGISAVTVGEVMLGSFQGKLPPLARLEQFLRVIPLLPFDEAAARAYARLPFRRARFDRLVAAHALSLDAAIVTNNEADFADVPGLRVENWTVAA